jgi:hypothetical protein
MKNKKILYWAIVVVFAVFLFGLNAVVFFGTDKQLEQIYCSSELYYGFVFMVLAISFTVMGILFDNFFQSNKEF